MSLMVVRCQVNPASVEKYIPRILLPSNSLPTFIPPELAAMVATTKLGLSLLKAILVVPNPCKLMVEVPSEDFAVLICVQEAPPSCETRKPRP